MPRRAEPVGNQDSRWITEAMSTTIAPATIISGKNCMMCRSAFIG
jgi:hypothetical protein